MGGMDWGPEHEDQKFIFWRGKLEMSFIPQEVLSPRQLGV